MTVASDVIGRWRIVEITGWDADYVDMLGLVTSNLIVMGATSRSAWSRSAWNAGIAGPASTSPSTVATRAPRCSVMAMPISSRMALSREKLSPRRRHAIHRQTLVNFRSLLEGVMYFPRVGA